MISALILFMYYLGGEMNVYIHTPLVCWMLWCAIIIEVVIYYFVWLFGDV